MTREGISRFRKLFGDRICYLRRQQKLTQEKLAEKAGIPDSGTIRRWEKGKEVPKFDRLEVLAHALEVKVRDLFDFGETEI